MSTHVEVKRKTVRDIAALKGKDKIAMLTAYTAPFARALDAHVDILLVGDSLGMVLYNMPSTLPVTLEMMIQHGKAVVSASEHAMVVIDMPFGSYHESKEQAFRSASRVLAETGAAAVKLEGGAVMAETIAFLVERGIPVMGHVGLMPQQVNAAGGYRMHGKTQDEKTLIMQDAKAVQTAGAFSIVLECTEASLADSITKTLTIPTIGIGASPGCDGQVLVTEDLVGLTPRAPKFVEPVADLNKALSDAAKKYVKRVKTSLSLIEGER